MITCHLRYEIDPDKLAEFEAYAKAWNLLVERFGGTHHGYFLPAEGPSDIAVALFSFPSLADYERYKQAIRSDPDCRQTWAFASKAGIMRRYDRCFMRPVHEATLEPLRAMHRT